MFLSEKIAEMVAMGSSVKEINKFKDTYSAEIIKGTLPDDAMEFAELTTEKRKALDDSDFALPGRRYPIMDEKHARNALARVAQNGTPTEAAKVRAAVAVADALAKVLELVEGK